MKRPLVYLSLVPALVLLFSFNSSIAEEKNKKKDSNSTIKFFKTDPIKIEDVKNLGEPRIITDLPEDMKKK